MSASSKKKDPTVTSRSTRQSQQAAASAAALCPPPAPESSPDPSLDLSPSVSTSSALPMSSDTPSGSTPSGFTEDQWNSVLAAISAAVGAALVTHSALAPAVHPRAHPRIEICSPDDFDGSKNTSVDSFLNQCTLVFRAHPLDFPTDIENINYAASFLCGPALQWFYPFFTNPRPSGAAHDAPCVLDTWSIFSDKLVETFGLPDASEHAETHLLSLAMLDSHHVHQYAIEFSADLISLNNLTFDSFDNL
ncbi:hypothetical protein FRC18_004325 [Serendipita sp. 400]|nr:hypothetical protein FRC18_004325 [Serendipita sp. 400]